MLILTQDKRNHPPFYKSLNPQGDHDIPLSAVNEECGEVTEVLIFNNVRPFARDAVAGLRLFSQGNVNEQTRRIVPTQYKPR